jgi:hypothetical protein
MMDCAALSKAVADARARVALPVLLRAASAAVCTGLMLTAWGCARALRSVADISTINYIHAAYVQGSVPTAKNEAWPRVVASFLAVVTSS